jgi:ribosome-associated protein
MSETTAKRNIQRLQRAIVDGLEDVKAQDIRVFDTSQLSPLFERVIIAAGTSNRQTKALAASVRDKVREAGFPKPRLEGEDNGEWIIVDCGTAVVHVMQPNIRSYYNLEEIWGQTPVRMKFGAAKPVTPTKAATAPAAGKSAAAPKASARRRAASASEGAAPKVQKLEEKPAVSGKKRSASAPKKKAIEVSAEKPAAAPKRSVAAERSTRGASNAATGARAPAKRTTTPRS